MIFPTEKESDAIYGSYGPALINKDGAVMVCGDCGPYHSFWYIVGEISAILWPKKLLRDDL